MNRISIIIPVLNEEHTISALLDTLPTRYDSDNIAEIIVVDGGSNDATVSILEDRNNLILLQTKAGRARQMNAGAKAAKSNVFYFLHADSIPPEGFDQLILDEIQKGNQAGCFRMKFDDDHWWLQLAGWFTRFNWRICRGGDQSLFITKKLFDELGGFDERFPICEDTEMTSNLYKRNEFVVINRPITTSSRLYRTNGIWYTQFHFWIIHWLNFTGASPARLQNYYRRHFNV